MATNMRSLNTAGIGRRRLPSTDVTIAGGEASDQQNDQGPTATLATTLEHESGRKGDTWRENVPSARMGSLQSTRPADA